MTCLWSVMNKEFRHILRDPWLLAGVTVGAALLMVLMAYTFSADIEHLPLAVWDGDRTFQSRLYLNRFANDPFFELQYGAGSAGQARAWVKSGQVRAALIIPPGFSETLRRGERVPVQLIVDGAQPNTTHQLLGNAEALSAQFSVDLLVQRLARTALAAPAPGSPFEFRVRALFNPNLETINSILPGLMALALAMPALAASLSLVREKEQGSFEGLIATPIRCYQLLIGWGLLISTVARTQAQGLVGAFFLVMFEIILSGHAMPVKFMPPAAQLVATLMPLQHFHVIVQSIMLRGATLADLWPQVWLLGAVGVVLYALALRRLAGELD